MSEVAIWGVVSLGFFKPFPLENTQNNYILRYFVSEPQWDNFVNYNRDCVLMCFW